MSQYKLLSGVYFGDKLFQAGEVVELDETDPKVQGYIDRGSIAPHDPSEKSAEETVVSTPETPEVPEVPTQPEVTTDNPSPEQIEQALKEAGV